MKRWAMIAGALCGLQVSPAQAQGVVMLAPAGEWDLGSGPESCWISRDFGEGGKGIFFRIETFGMPGSYRIFMRGKALPQRDSGLLEFHTRFNLDGAPLFQHGVLAKSGSVPTLTYQSTLAADEQPDATKPPVVDRAREEEIRDLTLTFSRGAPLLLSLGSMAEPMERLRECATGLPGKWGFDAEQQRSLRRPATPIDLKAWLEPGTFPWEYLRTAQSITIYTRIMVDDQGMPTDCVIQSPRFERAASEIACRTMMANARFEPALDSSGEPVASFFTTSVFYATERRNGV